MADASTPLQIWREREDRLLRLRLARPRANVIDAAMIGALDAALASHLGDPSAGAPAGAAGLRGVLLDAEGPHFSFGASVEEHLPATAARMLASLHALVLRMLASPVPILVAIRGQCLGGGLEVASAAHLLFAAPDARLGQPEIQLAVFAPAASCLLPERVGRAAAEDLLLSGRSVDGREAHRLGLVSAVADDPEAAALAYFDEHLAKRSASSLRFATRAARLDLVDRVRAKLEAVERLYLGGLMATRDAVEGLTAFLEKRPARWEDR
jgi:cyclohexa-1,5-dienecarbonyl-CoA hydratase